jgi:hypothetical protein
MSGWRIWRARGFSFEQLVGFDLLSMRSAVETSKITLDALSIHRISTQLALCAKKEMAVTEYRQSCRSRVSKLQQGWFRTDD